MYVEIAPRKSGKTYNLLVDAICNLYKNIHNESYRVAVICFSQTSMDYNKMLYKSEFDSEVCRYLYNKIDFYYSSSRSWHHSIDFRKYSKLYFDEFLFQKYTFENPQLVCDNGYYTSSENIDKITKDVFGKLKQYTDVFVVKKRLKIPKLLRVGDG